MMRRKQKKPRRSRTGAWQPTLGCVSIASQSAVVICNLQSRRSSAFAFALRRTASHVARLPISQRSASEGGPTRIRTWNKPIMSRRL